jgi:hypothetical protein
VPMLYHNLEAAADISIMFFGALSLVAVICEIRWRTKLMTNIALFGLGASVAFALCVAS